MPDPYRLNDVRRAAAKRRTSEQGYRLALRRARDAGASLSQIGEAAGVTYQTIWRALERAKERET